MWHKIKMRYYCFMWKFWVGMASASDALRKEQSLPVKFRVTENHFYKCWTKRHNYYYRKMLTCDLSENCKRIVEKFWMSKGGNSPFSFSYILHPIQ